MGQLTTGIVVSILALATGAEAQTTAIRFGRLWTGSRSIADAVVIVKGDRITRVDHGVEPPPGAE